VISVSLTRIAAMVAVIAISATTAVAWPHKHGQKTRVRFLAAGTLVRGTFGRNEDTYLAELSLEKGSERTLVRLVDAYPNEAPPISRTDLTAPFGITLRIRRDVECDRPYGEMILRTAPGDLMAILHERLGYQPQLSRTPTPNAIFPCYHVLR